mgnify:FL=1
METQYDKLMRPRAIASPPARGFNGPLAAKIAQHQAIAAALAQCPGASLATLAVAEHGRNAIRNRAGRIAQARREPAARPGAPARR